ncbi:Phosphoribosyl-ATP pyrophosphatase [Liberibacter crescens BT-1]|uniref:Phosphoribosyl-ATP pyrophosphatase n=1 Tax=Liberibacter crescens (strain BT-1) TaxID=1215343 RepID=L0EWV2_LIBCB|nr:phosphoribosyl-ATP diphosphatase [Liberibacter crescens]AGA65345.1 Phosphoribosyl-ATP pyrophosphatase [Liberibacter crescens BT-1]AMC12286.1 phosphoribosyl-ATP pyrophosphatase [Liberibacter crescens]
MEQFSLYDLERIVEQSANKDPEESWTASLIKGGKNKAAQKLGEEALETVIASINSDRNHLIHETADLLYHLLVVLKIAHVPIKSVMVELEKRTAQSGIFEKLNRKKSNNVF